MKLVVGRVYRVNLLIPTPGGHAFVRDRRVKLMGYDARTVVFRSDKPVGGQACPWGLMRDLDLGECMIAVDHGSVDWQRL